MYGITGPMPSVMMGNRQMPTGEDTGHRSFPSAEEMERRMKERTTGGMTNMGGFDPSSLMSAPQLRQDATMNQANMVSSPYFEANEKAAEKTNPMNAASQEPGKSFLMKFIGK